MRIVERPRGSTCARKVADEPGFSRARRTVTQRAPESRCSWTTRPANELRALTCVPRRAPPRTASETAGRTATVTDALVVPFAVAWYEVRIAGRAEYVHVPPAPVLTVAIDRKAG